MARTSRSASHPAKPEQGRFRRIAMRILKYGSILALMVLIGVGIAVGVAASNLPSFE